MARRATKTSHPSYDVAHPNPAATSREAYATSPEVQAQLQVGLVQLVRRVEEDQVRRVAHLREPPGAHDRRRVEGQDVPRGCGARRGAGKRQR